MAATNPLRVKDLLHKYGWDFIPRLASLGTQYQAEAQVLFVDSGATNTLDADDGIHGHSFENPLATIDYAIGLCVASEGAVILVAPGHVEDLAAATIDFDVAGVTCIGLGKGTLRPQIHFNNAAASVDIGANNVTLINFGFLPSVTGVSIGVDVETGITNFKMADCEFMMGEAGDGTDEFIKAIHLTSGNHDCIFENVKIFAHASAAQATHGIHVDAASNRLTFKNVVIDGPYATAGILEDAAGLNHIVEDCSVDVSGTNYSFHASSTFAKRARNTAALAEQWASRNTDIRTIAGKFYVDANVAASGSGLSWDSPVKTITEALALATTRNDIIYVAPGDYDEGATLAVATQGLQIIGPGPDTQNKAMVYDGASAGYDLMTINNHEVVIDGLAFSAAADTYDGIVLGGVTSSYKVTIRNCRFDGWSGEYGIQTAGDCPDLLIENNLFRSWNTAAVQLNCTRACVRNNIFHVVTDKIGIEHVSAGGDRPDSVYVDNLFSGVANASTTGIKFTGAPSNGTCIVARNMFAGTWDTSITQVAASIGINNYVADGSGGALIDTVT